MKQGKRVSLVRWIGASVRRKTMAVVIATTVIALLVSAGTMLFYEVQDDGSVKALTEDFLDVAA